MHEYGSINGKQPGRRGGPLDQDWSPLEAPWLLLYPGAHSHRQIPLAEPTCPAAHATMHMLMRLCKSRNSSESRPALSAIWPGIQHELAPTSAEGCRTGSFIPLLSAHSKGYVVEFSCTDSLMLSVST